jgi:hypothetical protein
MSALSHLMFGHFLYYLSFHASSFWLWSHLKNVVPVLVAPGLVVPGLVAPGSSGVPKTSMLMFDSLKSDLKFLLQ